MQLICQLRHQCIKRRSSRRFIIGLGSILALQGAMAGVIPIRRIMASQPARRVRLPDNFTGSLGLLYAAAEDGDDELVRTLLGDLVQEYHPAREPATAMAMASPYPDR